MAQRIDSLSKLQTPLLKEILLTDDKLSDWTIGASVLSIDSVLRFYSGQSLASILSKESHLRIRSYGALSTSSIRGAGTAHTQVLWNGLTLNSPMNGGYDLSLMPLFFVQNIQVQPGGLGSLLGGGSIGGSIHLNQNLQFNQGEQLQFQSNFGSYSNNDVGLKAQLSGFKSVFDVAIYQQQSKNNFPYTDPYTDSSKKLSHANQSSRAFQSSYSQQLSSRLRADVIYFYQEANRLVPPSLLEAESTAEKEETAHRLLLKTQYLENKTHWNTQFSFASDRLLFVDTLKNTNVNHLTEQIGFMQSVQLKANPRHQFRLEQSLLHQIIYSKSILSDVNHETRYAFGANYLRILSEFSSLILSARQELNAAVLSPFLPSVAYKYSRGKQNVLECSLGRSYRNPSWNDRYWNPGGNPDLKAEDGAMINLSYEKSFTLKRFKNTAKLGLYFGRISDWILWLPSAAYWTSRNLALVEQKGVELAINSRYSSYVGVFTYSNLCSVQSARNLSERASGDAALGKQLIYVPLVQLNHSINWQNNAWNTYLQHHYESVRYTSDDHSSSLPAYHTLSVGLQKNWLCKKYDFSLGFQVDNLSNTSFQLMQGYAMPGRTLNVNLKFAYK